MSEARGSWCGFLLEKIRDEDHLDCGRRTGGEIRAAAGAGGQVSDRGGGFGGGRAGSASSRATGPGAAGRRSAWTGRGVILEMDARAGERSAGIDGFGAGYGEDRG